MAKCSFCGEQISKGTGKLFVKNDGRQLNFCSMKCEKNTFKLKRKPHTTRWTKTFHKLKNKQ
ncbi:50S ribosomal protein L24e [Candidatus Woesearchaeota archaeon]|jgi:large subunit ribosomal protein L24e|nr:50S ribosomal protein L24e [Candidatus Woesearchaeota archaeon]MBT5272272.1 50S ribosomal protein L24e [Candidatus Woesearchaeota archaeon]MBT6041135.1 50S ribosomal protein L24e [Candidatus Woesearchaeota archaeon]MBT6336544.1 50S ribosomal protein L24e [Candidatus Woesearchaeota archaeon]MBT7927434.1 50S ribosomal protein L24e [Candidatus Woesearchaeota archaeon]